MKQLLSRYGSTLTGAMVLATFVWLVGVVVLPHLVMVNFSLRPNLLPAQLGSDADHDTPGNYGTLFRNEIHFVVFLRTIWGSTPATFLCLSIASHPHRRTPEVNVLGLVLISITVIAAVVYSVRRRRAVTA